LKRRGLFHFKTNIDVGETNGAIVPESAKSARNQRSQLKSVSGPATITTATIDTNGQKTKKRSERSIETTTRLAIRMAREA
jgi:hypothetical protein